VLKIKNRYFNIGVDCTNEDLLSESLDTTFPRRYLPEYKLSRDNGVYVDALVKWIISNDRFELIEYRLGEDKDSYIIRSSPPKPYINESPVFFLLQIITRVLIKKGYIVLTDTSAVWINGKTILLVGYPHTGKSTLSALALYHGDIPLSTENTVIEIDGGEARIINGTSVLVYDPRIEDLFNVKIKYDELTRHGYRIIDLNKHVLDRKKILEQKPVINQIYILHCSYRSGEPDLEPVRGRKIRKTLWYFATALIKGIDYYEPNPLDLSTDKELEILGKKIDRLGEIYGDKINEIYGRHDKVYEYIRKH